MKGGEIEVMKHFLFNTRTADECWASYLIAKESGVFFSKDQTCSNGDYRTVAGMDYL